MYLAAGSVVVFEPDRIRVPALPIPDGRPFHIGRSHVLVLPAGTGHCNAGSSADLLVVGAYPNGSVPARA